MQWTAKSQNASTSTPRGIVTPCPSTGRATVLPNCPVTDISFPCWPLVITVTEKRSPSLSSNLRVSLGPAFAKGEFRFDKTTATANGSCSGGPLSSPKTVLLVAAKKFRRACKIRRRTDGGEDKLSVSVKIRACTAGVARTWWVRSRLMRVVLEARIGFEKIDSAASGSHWSWNCQKVLDSSTPSQKKRVRKNSNPT